jgi:hypothetical protein
MKERKENNDKTRLQIEVFLDHVSEKYFLDVLGSIPQIDSNTPLTIGAFSSLDEALRYTYTRLDKPEGLVEVVSVTKGELAFDLGTFEEHNLTLFGPQHLFDVSRAEFKIKDNVVDIRSKHDEDK